MNIKALRLLNVRPEEQAKVILMLSMGFFIGIFVATYQVTAESLFLNKLSDRLNQAFLISGGLGIGITLIFSFFHLLIFSSFLSSFPTFSPLLFCFSSPSHLINFSSLHLFTSSLSNFLLSSPRLCLTSSLSFS